MCLECHFPSEGWCWNHEVIELLGVKSTSMMLVNVCSSLQFSKSAFKFELEMVAVNNCSGCWGITVRLPLTQNNMTVETCSSMMPSYDVFNPACPEQKLL